MAVSRSFGATELTIRPSMRISPSLAVSSTAMMARSVDLPQPDGPTSAMNSPVRASRSIPLRTSTEPKRLVSRETVSVAIVAQSFDGALRKPTNEILAAEQIDQDRRKCAADHRRARDIIGVRTLLTRRERNQRGGDRLLRSAGEDDAQQKIISHGRGLPDERESSV